MRDLDQQLREARAYAELLGARLPPEAKLKTTAQKKRALKILRSV